MIVITKCKDGSFIISNGRTMKVVETKAEVVATIYWNYLIKPPKTNHALDLLETRDHDLVEIDYHGYIQGTRKIDYDEMFDD